MVWLDTFHFGTWTPRKLMGRLLEEKVGGPEFGSAGQLT